MTRRLHDLLEDPARLVEVAPAEAASLLVELAALQSGLAARLAIPPASLETPTRDRPRNGLLTLEEAAKRLRKTKRWMLDHWRREFPTARKIGRTVLIPEIEIDRWPKRA